MNLTPIQIRLLADVYAAYERGPDEVVAVWGSWYRAAEGLIKHFALISLGTAHGTREMEWHALHGRHRCGPAGRLVHLYKLASGHPHIVKLAARCALAVQRLPAGRQHATMRDIPDELPEGDRCPECGCRPGTPCIIVLANGCGEAGCVPAGVFGFERCSACQAKKEAA
jgi:hypothetical protein